MSKSQRESKTPTTPSSTSSSSSSSSSSTTSSSTPKSKPSKPSHHFSTRPEPFDPPRKSEKRSRRKPLPKAASSSVPSICSHHRTQQPPPASLLSNKISQYEHLDDAAARDMDAAKNSPPAKPAELQVPRILTENPKLPAEHNARASSPPAAAGLHRLRLRAHTPRLAGYFRRTGASPVNTAGAVRHGKQQQKGGRLSDSLAVVKTSSDPQRDFRDSMMEMIVEEEMQTSDELEDLLACYLSLNSKDHHDVIVEVFKQIWVDLSKKLEL